MRAPLDLEKDASSEIYGKECAGCHAALDFIHFRRDSSYRDGHTALCYDCEAEPKLSTGEHVARLEELNYNSEATKAQRWDHQDELLDSEARIGRPMKHSDFFAVLKRLVPNLYIVPGRIQGHLAVYQTAACPQPQWNNRDFRYLFYAEEGLMPEFSQYEVGERDIVKRESKRGWRTVLLRLIKMGLLTEPICNKVFGAAEGHSSERYRRELWKYRNRMVAQ
jgi:hypothetical protein